MPQHPCGGAGLQEIDCDPLGVMRRTSRYGTTLDASEAPVDHGFTELTFGASLPSFATALSDPEAALGEAESVLLYEYPEGDAPMRTLALGAEQFVDRGPDAGAADQSREAAMGRMGTPEEQGEAQGGLIVAGIGLAAGAATTGALDVSW